MCIRDRTVNALAAADTTLIPVQAQYLSAKGLEQLLDVYKRQGQWPELLCGELLRRDLMQQLLKQSLWNAVEGEQLSGLSIEVVKGLSLIHI